MADNQNQTDAAPETAVAAVEETVFSHHLELKQYVEGLEAELRAAVKAEHKKAIQAELEHVRGARAVKHGAPEQA